MTDDCRFFLYAVENDLEVIRDLSDGFVRECFGTRLRLGDGFRIVRPTRRECDVSCLLEQRRPTIPAARQQPESMYEHDGLESSLVRSIDLLSLVIGNRWCAGGGGLRCGAHARPPLGVCGRFSECSESASPR